MKGEFSGWHLINFRARCTRKSSYFRSEAYKILAYLTFGHWRMFMMYVVDINLISVILLFELGAAKYKEEKKN